MTLAACAFALAIVLNAVAGVTMALIGVCLLVFSSGPRAAVLSRALTDLRLTAAVIAVAVVAIRLPYSVVGEVPRLASSALPVLAIALGAWHLFRKGARHPMWGVGAALIVTGLIAGVYVIRATGGMGLDVLLLHQAAASALAHGENIYGSAVTVPNGAPGMPAGSMIVGYPYPPVAAAAYAAATWMFGDPRWMNLAAWAVMIACVVVLVARRQMSVLPVLLAAALPGWAAMLQSGWTEMLSVALIALAAVTWTRPVGSGVALGLALASKQYFAITVPLLLLHRDSRARRAPVALAAAALTLLPAFLTAPADAWRAMVLWHARTPPRLDSATLTGVLAQFGVSWSAPPWLPLAVGPLVMVLMARRATDAAGFWRACAAGLAVFFLLSSQAMPNYWYLIAVIAIVGAGLEAETSRPLAVAGMHEKAARREYS